MSRFLKRDFLVITKWTFFLFIPAFIALLIKYFNYQKIPPYYGYLISVYFVFWYLFFSKYLFNIFKASTKRAGEKDLRDIFVDNAFGVGLVYIILVVLIVSVTAITAKEFGVVLNQVNANTLDFIYWSSTTFTTLGYGEYYPTNNVGRFFSMALSILGTLHMAMFVSLLITLIPLSTYKE